MITQQFTYTLSGGTAPYTYAFVPSSSCVSFSPSQGTTNGVVSAVATYDDETCVLGVTLSLDVVDAQGCKSSFSLNPVNPCSSLDMDSIVQLDDYKFRAVASSSGCSSATFA